MSSSCFDAQYLKNLEFPADSLDISMQVIILMNKRDSFKNALISSDSCLRNIRSTLCRQMRKFPEECFFLSVFSEKIISPERHFKSVFFCPVCGRPYL